MKVNIQIVPAPPDLNAGSTVQKWARELLNSLTTSQKWEMSDQLTLGLFDWEDWTDEKPPRGGVTMLDTMLKDCEWVGQLLEED